jgi:threonyl-tRNA synthetase
MSAVELGAHFDLFFQDDMSPGSIFWKPKGGELYNNLIRLMRVLYNEYGFIEVVSPNIFDKELWKTSGHWWKYRENMFILQQERYVDPEDEAHGVLAENEENEENDENDECENDTDCEDNSNKKLFSLKGMNCPGHCVIFDKMRVYSKDMPIRMAEFGVLHRNENSGSLHGLTRVRRFQQDDAHIFCRLDQIQDEVFANLKMIERVYSLFDLKFVCELSTRPEKYIGSEEVWDHAEAELKSAIARYIGKSESKVKVKKGDGAFYGPKIDISLFDGLKRKIQCGTIQLDFNLPSEDRFNLKYLDEVDEGEPRQPVIVHRAVLGSLERFIGIVLEYTQGKLPLGVTPYPMSIITVMPEFAEEAEALKKRIHSGLASRGVHLQIETDYSSDDIRQKIKKREKMRYAMILAVGQREADQIKGENGEIESANIAVRRNKKISNMTPEEIVDVVSNAYNLC